MVKEKPTLLQIRTNFRIKNKIKNLREKKELKNLHQVLKKLLEEYERKEKGKTSLRVH